MHRYGTLIVGVLMLSFFSSAWAEDYADFAAQKEAEKSVVMAPYLKDAEEAKANAMQNMQRLDLQQLMQTASAATNAKPLQADSHVSSPVMIFVSFSMPKDSLKLWIEQANKIGAKVVLRGLVNNSFKQTKASVSQVIEKGQGGLQIDPTLFTRFSIQKVPAVVITQAASCPGTMSCSPAFDVIYGNVSLDYALEKLAKANTVRAFIARDALQKIRG